MQQKVVSGAKTSEIQVLSPNEKELGSQMQSKMAPNEFSQNYGLQETTAQSSYIESKMG